MELDQTLRDHGYRNTSARRVVWGSLIAADGHVTAAELADAARSIDPSVNVSSVYRALELFAELGLVRESRTDSLGSATWEVRHPDGEIHLVCDRCGSVAHHHTARVDQLRADLDRSGLFAVDAVDVRVLGRCAACSELAGER